MSVEYRWQLFASEGWAEWRPTVGRTERDGADHVARLVGASCPVPGAYRDGTGKATPTRNEHEWIMPTGARIQTRTVEGSE